MACQFLPPKNLIDPIITDRSTLYCDTHSIANKRRHITAKWHEPINGATGLVYPFFAVFIGRSVRWSVAAWDCVTYFEIASAYTCNNSYTIQATNSESNRWIDIFTGAFTSERMIIFWDVCIKDTTKNIACCWFNENELNQQFITVRLWNIEEQNKQ